MINARRDPRQTIREYLATVFTERMTLDSNTPENFSLLPDGLFPLLHNINDNFDANDQHVRQWRRLTISLLSPTLTDDQEHKVSAIVGEVVLALRAWARPLNTYHERLGRAEGLRDIVKDVIALSQGIMAQSGAFRWMWKKPESCDAEKDLVVFPGLARFPDDRFDAAGNVLTDDTMTARYVVVAEALVEEDDDT